MAVRTFTVQHRASGAELLNKMASKNVATSNLSDKLQELIGKASEVKEKAHCPYSEFPVGAALLTTSNEIFVGK